MKSRLLSKKQMLGLLTMEEVVDICDKTFREDARGLVSSRAKVPADILDDEGRMVRNISAMPAFVGWQHAVGCKFIGGNENRRAMGLPYICGNQLMMDPDTGEVTGVMEAEYLTQMRTGAQTGAICRYLKGQGAPLTVGVYGCGSQGLTQIQALSCVADVRELKLYDVYRPAAEAMAEKVKDWIHGPVTVCDEPAQAADADVIDLVTVARTPVLMKDMVKPGTLVFSLGVYHEVDNELIRAADKVIVDNVQQTMERGCLETLVKEGGFGPEDVYATVSQVLGGQKSLGRLEDQIILVVPIGTGMLDIAVGKAYLDKAAEKGVGLLFDFQEEE